MKFHRQRHDPITRGQLCWGGASASEVNECNGDSGGPVACKVKGGGRWTQYGVASFTSVDADGVFRCGTSVFTRVSEYSAWIWEIIDKH